MSSSFITGIFIAYIIFILVALVGSLASYLLKGFGMYQMGKNKGMTTPWLAFIPYANLYYQGELCGDIHFKKKQLSHPGAWLLGISFGTGLIAGTFAGITGSMFMFAFFRVLGQLGFPEFYEFAYNSYGIGSGGLGIWGVLFFISICVASAGSLFVQVLMIMINRQIFKECTDDSSAVAHAFLCLFVPFYEAIIFFVFRNRNKPAEMPTQSYPSGNNSEPTYSQQRPPEPVQPVPEQVQPVSEYHKPEGTTPTEAGDTELLQ